MVEIKGSQPKPFQNGQQFRQAFDYEGTFPIVFVTDGVTKTYIGGSDELKRWIESQ